MRNTHNRATVISLGLVIGLVVAAGLVVLLRPSATEFDPTTPEGTVQSYVRAVLDDDREQALALLEDPSDECDLDHHRRDSIRVTLEGVETTDDHSKVTIRMTTQGGEPPFDTYEYTERVTFELTRVEGNWLITRAPWPFQICRERMTP